MLVNIATKFYLYLICAIPTRPRLIACISITKREHIYWYPFIRMVSVVQLTEKGSGSPRSYFTLRFNGL